MKVPDKPSQHQKEQWKGGIPGNPQIQIGAIHQFKKQYGDYKPVRPDGNGRHVPESVRIDPVERPVVYPEGGGCALHQLPYPDVVEPVRHLVSPTVNV